MFDVETVNGFVLAALPSIFTRPPLEPKMIGLEFPPALVLPAPEVKRSSAAPPGVLALRVMLPPVPIRLAPVVISGISAPLENSSSTPPVIVVPPVQELPVLVKRQLPPVTVRVLLPLMTPPSVVKPVPVP